MDMPAGGGRWLTVVSPEDPDGVELTLEPMGFASSRTYQKALYEAGLPLTTLLVTDELPRLALILQERPMPIPIGSSAPAR